MLRVGIAAVNAVAEDRHISHGGQAVALGHDQELVHGALEVIEHDFGIIGLGIEEQDLRAHLVDRDQALRILFIAHRFFP